MTAHHQSLTLQPGSPYLERTCPSTRQPLKVGDRVIVCRRYKEAFSQNALPDLEGRCPFCNNLLPQFSYSPPPPSNQPKQEIKPVITPPSPQRALRTGKLAVPLFIVLLVGLCLVPLGCLMLYNTLDNTTSNINGDSTYPTSASRQSINSPTPYLDTSPTHVPTPTRTPTQQSPITNCPGAPAQRVHVGDRVWVCTQYDRLIVREQPRLSGREIARLEPGTYGDIIDGPNCANGYSWWKIRADSGTIGWVSEGGDDVDPYFICLVR